MVQSFRKYKKYAVVSGGIFLFASCANMSSPSGGAYDLDPPVVMRTSPEFNATQVKHGKVIIDFDENVTVENPLEKVIITPPQKSFPVIHLANRRVTVELKDSLIANTTYTIDFTDAIADNNEKNALENFSFSFSTGDHVDTLSMSGRVLDASNLEPVKGMYVGLHSNLSDTAFTKTKFLRISRTNDRGVFTIKGVAPGTYRIYALDDANRDYMYNDPTEAIAFQEATVAPTIEKALRYDTTFVVNAQKKRVVDTVKTVEYSRFLPDDILLRSFKSGFKRQYLVKYDRTPNQLVLYFGAPTDLPKMEALTPKIKDDWYVMERTPRNDTITYWIKDEDMKKIDTLSFKLSYMKTDSLNQLVSAIDTLQFMDRTRKATKKEKKDKDEQDKITFLNIKNNLSSTWDTHKDINLEFSEPLKDSVSSKIKLFSVKDSLFKPIPFTLVIDSLNPRKFVVKNKWQYGNEYKILIDSASVYSMYGLWNDKLSQSFKVKNEDEYSQLAININGLDSVPAFVELLDKSDNVVRKSKVWKDNVALFKDVDPGTYYARIVLDRNNNGVWDTGDFHKQLQPDMVYYYNGHFELKANWLQDETWTLDTSNSSVQKPLEVTKNKPQEKESKRKQLEKDDQKKQDQNKNRTNLQTGNNQMPGNTNLNTQNATRY